MLSFMQQVYRVVSSVSFPVQGLSWPVCRALHVVYLHGILMHDFVLTAQGSGADSLIAFYVVVFWHFLGISS